MAGSGCHSRLGGSLGCVGLLGVGACLLLCQPRALSKLLEIAYSLISNFCGEGGLRALMARSSSVDSYETYPYIMRQSLLTAELGSWMAVLLLGREALASRGSARCSAIIRSDVRCPQGSTGSNEAAQAHGGRLQIFKICGLGCALHLCGVAVALRLGLWQVDSGCSHTFMLQMVWVLWQIVADGCGLMLKVGLGLCQLVSVMCLGVQHIVAGGYGLILGCQCSELLVGCLGALFYGAIGHVLLPRLFRKLFSNAYNDRSMFVSQMFLRASPELVVGYCFAESMLSLVASASPTCRGAQPWVATVVRWTSWLAIVNVLRLVLALAYQLRQHMEVMQTIIRSLVPVDSGDLTDKVECSVCCEECATGEAILRTPCRSFFHRECLEPWLALA